jgi:hypothetical protein
MAKSRSRAMVMLGLACLLLIACQTAGKPKQSGGTPTKSRTTAGPQAPPPAGSVSKNKTASYTGDVGRVTSAQRKHLTAGVTDIFRSFSSAAGGQAIKTMRLIIYAALAVIFIVVIGATTATRVGRHRRLTPSSVNARH